MGENTDRALIDRQLASYTARGWRILAQDENGVQLAEPKKLNPVGMSVFVLLPGVLACVALLIAPIYGIILAMIACVGLALVMAEYRIRPETLHYFTIEQLRRN